MLHNLLKQKNSYYANLSADGQIRFQERLLHFMESKEFIGRQELIVTDEIKILISASAIQLTFGLAHYTFSHLYTINIFPHIFYSKFYNTSFKGLTTQGGVLSLSWEDFKEGYSNGYDRLNLGLHEFTHALTIELDKDGRYDKNFSHYFKHWQQIAFADFEKLKAGNNPFFRNYGAASLHEFFAVCIEHFFESSKEFKLLLPELYGNIALMLNQDPDNVTEDYRLKENEVYLNNLSVVESEIAHNQKGMNHKVNQGYMPDSKFQNFIRKNGVYVAMATTIMGLFVGIPVLIWFSSTIIISIGSVFLLIFICGGLGLMQWKFVKEYIDMEYRHFAMYSFSGFGMCMVNFVLFLNYNIRISEHSETYTIIWVNQVNQKTEILIEEASSALSENINTFFNKHYQPVSGSAKEITVFFDKGLVGFDMVSDCQFH